MTQDKTRYLLAHDLGTSGNKATLFAESGALVGSRTAGYGTRFFNQNWAEQEPEDWWTAVCESTRQLLAQHRITPETIAAVSFSGHMMGCLCLDADGCPVRPHILWADQRATAEAAALDRRLGEGRFYRITGNRCTPTNSLPKLMWVRDHEPAVYARTAHMVNAKDWLVFRLTGRLATEPSDASGTGMLDLDRLEWSEEILSAAGIGHDKLPEIIPSTAIAGTVTLAAAAATGLAAGTPVVMGGGDGCCATVGAGCVAPGDVYGCIGSSAWIAMTAEQPLYDPNQRTFNLAHIIPGLVSPIGTMQAAGNAISWLKNEIVQPGGVAEAAGTGVDANAGAGTVTPAAAAATGLAAGTPVVDAYARMQAQLGATQPGANGVRFLPYLLGERSPWWNADARGAFIGIRMDTTQADLVRSVFEGITFNLGLIIDCLKANAGHDGALDFRSVKLIGGGARNDLWCAMMADIWQTRIQRMSVLEEATSMGAAVTAGVGIGLYPDFSAINRYTQAARTFEPDPDPAVRQAYAMAGASFEACYRQLESVFPGLV